MTDLATADANDAMMAISTTDSGEWKWKLRNHHRYYNVYVEEKDPNRDNRIEESLKMLIDNIQYRNYNRNRYANNHHRQ